MGKRSASLLRGKHPPVEQELATLQANAAATQDDQPFAWTILLSVSSGYLRWRSIRPVPDSEPTRGVYLTTTGQMLLASTRLGDAPVLYRDRYLRNDETPVPLTPDQIEARDDLDFYLDRCQREREQDNEYHREWIPRLRKLGLVKCRLGGLPTGDGRPCACSTCRGVRSESSPLRPPVPLQSP